MRSSSPHPRSFLPATTVLIVVTSGAWKKKHNNRTTKKQKISSGVEPHTPRLSVWFPPFAREAIAREGKVRALAILEGFEGWERHDDWGDVSFMTEQGRHLEKMAIVGDVKWRDDALAFYRQRVSSDGHRIFSDLTFE